MSDEFFYITARERENSTVDYSKPKRKISVINEIEAALYLKKKHYKEDLVELHQLHFQI